MYGARPIRDAVRVLRACATNQLARVAPRAYIRLTGETGRGERSAETPSSIARYFLTCFTEYFEVLGVGRSEIALWLRGKRLLEYGPGDIPGVALLMIAHGAEKVFCVDRFPLLSLSKTNAAVIDRLLDELPADARHRATQVVHKAGHDGAVTLDVRGIEYLVRPSGLSGMKNSVDLVYSRAVLEHVDDLHSTFADMGRSLRAGGSAVHLVDLKSHGLHRANQLDFLTWPPLLWNLMYSHKGVPNRWRVDRYRDIVHSAGLIIDLMKSTGEADPSEVAEVRPHLPAIFRNTSDADLAWLGFWLVCRKAPGS